jgi:hypothetical protein
LVKAQAIQPYKKEAYEDASKRITLVVIMAEDPKKAKLKKNVAEAELAKKDMEKFNSDLQSAIKKWWKFTERYEFKSLAEVQKITKGKTNKGYLVLQYIFQNELEGSAKPNAPQSAILPFNKLSKPEAFGYFELRQAENMVATKPALAYANLAFQAPSLFDDVFAIHTMQYDLYNHMEGLSPNEIKRTFKLMQKIY